MPKCRLLLPSDFPVNIQTAVNRHKLCSVRNTRTQAHSWMDGQMHEMTIPITINVGWGKVIWIHQHAKFYAIPSKWFVSKCAEIWKCAERIRGWTNRRVAWGYSCVPLNLVQDNKWGQKLILKNVKQKKCFLWCCNVWIKLDWPIVRSDK